VAEGRVQKGRRGDFEKYHLHWTQTRGGLGCKRMLQDPFSLCLLFFEHEETERGVYHPPRRTNGAKAVLLVLLQVSGGCGHGSQKNRRGKADSFFFRFSFCLTVCF